MKFSIFIAAFVSDDIIFNQFKTIFGLEIEEIEEE